MTYQITFYQLNGVGDDNELYGVFPKRYAGALTSSTSECELIWK